MDITKITSRDNEKLKLVRRVRDGKENGSVFIEGLRLCAEAVRSCLTIEHAFVSEPLLISDSFKQFEAYLSSVTVLSETLLNSIVDTKSPQGIVLIAERPKSVEIDSIFHSAAGSTKKSALSLFLFQVNNPSNLGAVMRTAEAAGVNHVIVSTGSADPFSPKALRASMGSAFRAEISSAVDFSEAAAKAKENGIRILAVDVRGKSIYTNMNWREPSLLVFGSEADGLPESALQLADETISIPMESPVESLNLAVSCGIILFEARRQIQQNQ